MFFFFFKQLENNQSCVIGHSILFGAFQDIFVNMVHYRKVGLKVVKNIFSLMGVSKVKRSSFCTWMWQCSKESYYNILSDIVIHIWYKLYQCSLIFFLLLCTSVLKISLYAKRANFILNKGRCLKELLIIMTPFVIKW